MARSGPERPVRGFGEVGEATPFRIQSSLERRDRLSFLGAETTVSIFRASGDQPEVAGDIDAVERLSF